MTRRGWSIRWSVSFAVAGVIALCGAAPALADTATFTKTGCLVWTAPAGLTGAIAVDAVGGAGGTGGFGALGGAGDEVAGSLDGVSAGQSLDVCVGSGAVSATLGGGAGGGASGVSLGSDFGSPVLVAGGGGGGGSVGGSGGAAEAMGSGTGSSSTAGGPAPGGAGSGGGGGGGAGYRGGVAGSNPTQGGAGGSNYCALSSCSSAAATGLPQVTLVYTVSSSSGGGGAPPPPPPTIWLPMPSNGAVFTLGQAVSSAYLCADGTSAPGIASCVDQSGHATGAPLDTSTLGHHTFTVTATSSDGQATTMTSTYTVVGKPAVTRISAGRHGLVTITVAVPAAGAIIVLEGASLGRSSPSSGGGSHGAGVFARATRGASRAETLRVVLKPDPLGRLLLRGHGRLSVALSVAYTAARGVQQTILSRRVRVRA